jgi:hypothetical protein
MKSSSSTMNAIACKLYTHGEHWLSFQWRGSFNRRDRKSKRFALRTFISTEYVIHHDLVCFLSLSRCVIETCQISSNNVYETSKKRRGSIYLDLMSSYTYSAGFKNTWFNKLLTLLRLRSYYFEWNDSTDIKPHLIIWWEKKYALDQFKYWSMRDKAWMTSNAQGGRLRRRKTLPPFTGWNRVVLSLKSSWTARHCAGMEREERKGALVGRKGQR